MKVWHLIPSGSVKKYVERILVINNDDSCAPFSLPLFANGQPTLVFVSKNGKIKEKRTSHLTLFGQTIVPESLDFEGGFTLIAYFFKPTSLLPLFNVSAHELTDNPIDLDVLERAYRTDLEERLLNTELIADRISLIDSYVCRLISQSRYESPVIERAVDLIVRNPSKVRLHKIHNELHLTERTFQRTFEHAVGIAPNMYRRVYQFNAAFQQLNSRSGGRLVDIAFQHGYADQSHFNRAFKEFTYLTPKAFLNLGSPDNQ